MQCHIERSSSLLLATRFGGQKLDPGHGFPARLVVPEGRAFLVGQIGKRDRDRRCVSLVAAAFPTSVRGAECPPPLTPVARNLCPRRRWSSHFRSAFGRPGR